MKCKSIKPIEYEVSAERIELGVTEKILPTTTFFTALVSERINVGDIVGIFDGGKEYLVSASFEVGVDGKRLIGGYSTHTNLPKPLEGCYGVISKASLRAIKAATRAKKSNKKGKRASR